LYLHARLLLKISGKTAAIMLVVGFILLAISFYGIPLVSPIEHLDKPLESLTR
jgi:ABC-type transport system involved in cytochrome c biogenesis permease subunit